MKNSYLDGCIQRLYFPRLSPHGAEGDRGQACLGKVALWIDNDTVDILRILLSSWFFKSLLTQTPPRGETFHHNRRRPRLQDALIYSPPPSSFLLNFAAISAEPRRASDPLHSSTELNKRDCGHATKIDKKELKLVLGKFVGRLP